MKIKEFSKDIKIVITMTIAIFLFMIIISLINIKGFSSEVEGFEIDNSSVNKSSNISNDIYTLHGNDIAKVYNSNTGKVEEINVEEYIKGVVAAEMPANFEEEALKAQAVAARTYYYSKRINNCKNAHGAEICNSTHCQVYESKEEALSKWPESSKNDYWNKISKAVEDTKNQILTYKNELVLYPQFFAISWGKTEDSSQVFSQNIPYLQSTDSEGEEIANKYSSQFDVVLQTFVDTINNSYSDSGVTIDNVKSTVKVISNNESGSVKEIQLGNKKISGKDFRTLFNLNSANFVLTYNDSSVNISCKGYGHGLGMSQWGANVMAKEGKKYDEILKHYYSGVEIQGVEFD